MTQKVIGGEYAINPELLKTDKSVYNHIPGHSYASGRTALEAIIYSIMHTRPDALSGGVLVPDYICDSVTKVIKDIGVGYQFYHIADNMMPDQSLFSRLGSLRTVILINYFGLLDLQTVIEDIRCSYDDIIIIEDDVQNFFSEYNRNVDFSFTSLRKWFATPDGAFVKVNNKIYENALPSFANSSSLFSQYKFAGNILKNFSDYVDDQISLSLLTTGEKELDDNYRYDMSEASQLIYSHINLRVVANARKRNALFLHNKLLAKDIPHGYNADHIQLFVPIFLEKSIRDFLRGKLFENNIFVPIHWPHVSTELNGDNDLYDMELSLICDQRYTIEDMSRVMEIIYNEI